ncbi:MarR family winged helix-turn-helix transcriptional regulator [Methylocella sp.]|uniref:MarR family winged helix-turn-helix transcriptional regulator n=1 Tax=Methylocella sp. TaxID=1978226 RepID=UPI0037839D1C
MTVFCNCYALRQASRHVTQFYDHALAPSTLRATQYTMLSEIDKRGPISLLPLAEHMVMDRATLGHNLRLLETNGYITLKTGDDRRSREVSLTKAGRRALAEAEPLWRRAQDAFEAAIGPDQAAKLREALGRAAAADFTLRP